MGSTFPRRNIARGQTPDGSLQARVAIVAIGFLNLVVALLMIVLILVDGFKARSRNRSFQPDCNTMHVSKSRRKILTLIPAVRSADVFSLVISVATFLQGRGFCIHTESGFEEQSRGV